MRALATPLTSHATKISVRSALRGFTLAVSLALAVTAAAQDKPREPEESYVKSRYTKYEYRIPMRDGVKLFTAVYVPKDSAATYPILMDRTPYSVAPYGEDQYPKTLGPSDEFERPATSSSIRTYADVTSPKAPSSKCVHTSTTRLHRRTSTMLPICTTRSSTC